MSLLKVSTLEVGVRGQRITVRGSTPPGEGRAYDEEREMDLDLLMAKELYRLLGRLIPIAEKARTSAPVVTLQAKKDSA